MINLPSNRINNGLGKAWSRRQRNTTVNPVLIYRRENRLVNARFPWPILRFIDSFLHFRPFPLFIYLERNRCWESAPLPRVFTSSARKLFTAIPRDIICREQSGDETLFLFIPRSFVSFSCFPSPSNDDVGLLYSSSPPPRRNFELRDIRGCAARYHDGYGKCGKSIDFVQVRGRGNEAKHR